jgi:hypothetical protein
MYIVNLKVYGSSRYSVTRLQDQRLERSLSTVRYPSSDVDII